MNPPLKQNKIPLVKAIGWIVFSTLVISGSAYSGMNTYLRFKKKTLKDPGNQVNAIVQTGPQKEALKTDYLAELMGLSRDRPLALDQFDFAAAEKRLLTSPVIKKAAVKPLPPSTLYVDYMARVPVAWLYEYENTAIDEEGYFFPVYPFFTPKNLPEIYLGLPPFEGWDIPIKSPHLDLAFSLLKLIKETSAEELIHVRRIDVSNAFAESYGIREIVLLTEDRIGNAVHRRILRLSTKNYPQELANYLKLREQLIAKEMELPSSEKVIDLRLSKLGFIQEL